MTEARERLSDAANLLTEALAMCQEKRSRTAIGLMLVAALCEVQRVEAILGLPPALPG